MKMDPNSRYHSELRQAKILIFAKALEETAMNVTRAGKLLGLESGNFRRFLRAVQYPGYPFHRKGYYARPEKQGANREL